jgi:hypothetical protein
MEDASIQRHCAVGIPGEQARSNDPGKLALATGSRVVGRSIVAQGGQAVPLRKYKPRRQKFLARP